MRRLNACSGTEIHVEKTFGAQAIPTSRKELSNEYQPENVERAPLRTLLATLSRERLYCVRRTPGQQLPALPSVPKGHLHSAWVGKGRRRPY